MSQSFAEVLLLTVTTLSVGYLLFIATALQSTMQLQREEEFGTFLPLLFRVASRSVYMVVTGLATLAGAIPYFIIYGFDNVWFTAAMVTYLASSVAGKVLNLPVYEAVANLEASQAEELGEQRHRLRTANWVRALLALASVVLMSASFA